MRLPLLNVLLTALLAFTTAGCVITGPDSTGEISDLEEARATWNRVNARDYDLTMTRGCFCIGAGTMQVHVRRDTIAAIQQANNLWPGGNEWWTYIPTVDELFDLAARAEVEAYSVETSFHPELGYPVQVTIDWIENAVDDEISYSISALSLAPTTDVISLSIGETIRPPSGLQVTFNQILEDSRCALNANCVWAGQVTVSLEVTYDGSSHEVMLTLGDDPAEATGTVSDLTLSLIHVSPYPQDAGRPIPAEDYRIILLAGPE
ncbi:MAG: hypothetical protein HKN29_15225 [Rhodothermales bacterium]|nr:hypothetical protein [Rhodothermales bacterium]